MSNNTLVDLLLFNIQICYRVLLHTGTNSNQCYSMKYNAIDVLNGIQICPYLQHDLLMVCASSGVCIHIHQHTTLALWHCQLM